MRPHTSPRLVVAISLLTLVGLTVRPAAGTALDDDDTVRDVAAVLDDFNRAATDADFDAYFACLAPDGVFLGTDATERWTVDQLRLLVQPYFDQGRARAHTPRDRHVNLLPGGNVAFFDELVEIESLGECRGTGVVAKIDDAWLIAQYSMSVPVPNEIVFDVVDRIQAHHDGEDAPPADDDAGVRESLAAYVATASHPSPGPIDPELFAADIEALWSNGQVYRDRASVVEALEESQRELEVFDSFAARTDQVRIHRRDDVAWVACRIKMSGTLADGGAPFARTVRSTFVFERQDGRWRMIQEHSSRVPEGQ